MTIGNSLIVRKAYFAPDSILYQQTIQVDSEMSNPDSRKTVVITGAGSGIGRRLAELFIEQGAMVFALDINEDALQDSGSEHLVPVRVDLASRTSIEEAFAFIHRQTPHIDILINNAGVVFGRDVEGHTSEQIQKTFDINVISHFYTVQAVLPGMKRRNSGHIVTIASAGGLIGAPGMSAYTASKFAAVGFEETLRNELRTSGSSIDTTLVAPYYVNTGMFEGVRTRFSWLLPILDQEYVAQRIMKAIRRKKKRLVMPRFVYLVFPLRLFPIALFDWLSDFFGISKSMDHFRGRSPSSDQKAS
jgi:all-trans-retinol dehydrogenase (NAD+)